MGSGTFIKLIYIFPGPLSPGVCCKLENKVKEKQLTLMLNIYNTNVNCFSFTLVLNIFRNEFRFAVTWLLVSNYQEIRNAWNWQGREGGVKCVLKGAIFHLALILCDKYPAWHSPSQGRAACPRTPRRGDTRSHRDTRPCHWMICPISPAAVAPITSNHKMSESRYVIA